MSTNESESETKDAIARSFARYPDTYDWNSLGPLVEVEQVSGISTLLEEFSIVDWREPEMEHKPKVKACTWILVKGKFKGERCGKPTKRDDGLCTSHAR